MKKLGCAQCGKSMKKGGAKKMAKGGSMKKMGDGGSNYGEAITKATNMFFPRSLSTGPNDQGFANMKKGGTMKKKMAKGGSTFPDLTGDGKVTQADILKGRGVDIKKKGGAMKAKFGASVKVQRSPKAGKVRAAGDQGYAAVGKREPGRIIKKTIGKKK
jgi:hypothetical protein